jgi:hypothetical protein
MLETIINSILSDSNVINARKQYEFSLIDNKYQHLQWWIPSFSMTNNLVYPYKHKYFTNKTTSNSSSLDFIFPFPTGSILSLGTSYSITRDLLETSTLEKQDWGFIQDINYSIGISQSLNPWWFYTRHEPYSRSAIIESTLSKNEYNNLIKKTLFSEITNYINLRKIERSIVHLKETLNLYDKLLQAYRQLFTSGSVSWREYEKINSERWDYESKLFALEKERVSLQSELYQLTGIQIEDTPNELLPDIEDRLFMGIFMDIKKEAVNTLEETSLYLMKDKAQMARLLNRQLNSPSLKTVWSTLYNLPVSPSDSLGNVWKKDNFNDSIFNNWTLSVVLDLSSLLSPVNRRDNLLFKEEIRSIEELLKTLANEKLKEKAFFNFITEQIQEQIERLSFLVVNENIRLMEDETLKNKGIITPLEYEQSQLSYKEKQTLLLNLQDDFWLYTFIMSFY